MHLRNSCDRWTSTCCIRNSPSPTLGSGANEGICRAFSKLKDTSVTRSLITGKVRIGVTVMVSSGANSDILVMQASRGWPLISIEHEPHLPALQFQRTARSPRSEEHTSELQS